MTNRTGSEIEGGELTTPAYKDPRKDLANRSIAAAKWNYLGVVTRIAAQFISQIALARLLGPEQIGLFAFAVLLIGLGSIVVDLGLGAALVQAKRITRPDVRAVATWTFVAGVIVTGTLFICAPLLAVFFADIRTVDILRAISPVFIFQALAVVPVSLLKRELAFKQVQIAQVISYVLGFLFVGIGSAYLGAGVWSLVAAWLTQSATWAALLHLSLRRITKRPSETASDRQPSKLRGFSIQVLLTNLANWVIENADNLVVGKLFGAAALGLYSISYNLVRTPANSLVATLQAVLFAASSRAQDQQESLRRAYLTVVAATALVAFPVFVGVAAISNTLVTVLLGAQWSAAAPILAPLAIAMAFHTLMALAGPVLWATGNPGTELKVQIITAVIFVAAMLAASQFSVATLGWALLCVYAWRSVAMTTALLSQIQLPLMRLFLAMRGGVVASILIALLLFSTENYLFVLNDTLRLCIEAAASAIALAGFILAFPRVAISKELATLLDRILIKGRTDSILVRRIRLAVN